MRFSSPVLPSVDWDVAKADLKRVDAAILGLADDRHPPGSKNLQGEVDLYRFG